MASFCLSGCLFASEEPFSRGGRRGLEQIPLVFASPARLLTHERAGPRFGRPGLGGRKLEARHKKLPNRLPAITLQRFNSAIEIALLMRPSEAFYRLGRL